MRSAVLLFAFTNTHNHSLRDGARTDTRGSSGSTLVTSANSPSCVRMHWHVSSRGMCFSIHLWFTVAGRFAEHVIAVL